LDRVLNERVQLAEQLKLAKEAKETKVQEYRKKQRFMNDFPQILKTLEEATLPL
jgi:hypothetical protein